MNRAAPAFCAAILTMGLAGPARAERWVFLGNFMNSVMDLDSVVGEPQPSAWIRWSGRTEQGVLTTYLFIAAYCDQEYLYMLDGQLTSSWDAKVAPMPDMPEADRVIQIPTPNDALMNLFSFLCQAR